MTKPAEKPTEVPAGKSLEKPHGKPADKSKSSRKRKRDDNKNQVNLEESTHAVPKMKRMRVELIGNSFSKNMFMFVEKFNPLDGSVANKETFSASKFPKFLNAMMKTNPDIYVELMKSIVKVINEIDM